MYFCTNNAVSKSVVLLYMIFLYEKLKNDSIQSFQECSFFVFCLFCFLLLSNSTLHVIFYTYICYWNTFSCAGDYKRYLFTLHHIISLSISVLPQLRFISWSSPPPLLFNWLRVQLYLKVPNHIYVLKWHIFYCLIYFGFIECLYMYLFWQVFRGNFHVTRN